MRHWSTWLRVILSLGLLGLLLWQVGARNTLARLWQINPLDFSIALGLYLVGIWLRAWRWQGLLTALGHRIRMTRLTELYFVGTFFNNMLPTGIGGDVIRVVELARDGSGGAAAASSVLVDRATGLVSLMAMGLLTLGVALVWRPGLIEPSVALVTVLISAGVLGGMIAMLGLDTLRIWFGRFPWLARWLDKPVVRKFAQSFSLYRGSALTNALALSTGFNLQLVATNYFLGQGLHINGAMDAPWVYYLLFIPIISFILALPISISGLGAREAAYVALFGSVGVPADQALALSLAFYAVNLITGAVGGVWYLVGSLRGTRQRTAEGN